MAGTHSRTGSEGGSADTEGWWAEAMLLGPGRREGEKDCVVEGCGGCPPRSAVIISIKPVSRVQARNLVEGVNRGKD